MTEALKDTALLKEHISRALYEKSVKLSLYRDDVFRSAKASAVLFLVGPGCQDGMEDASPCIILNKRSAKVKQPGDLCFPGGRVSPKLDLFLSGILAWPFSPLRRWAYWAPWQAKGPEESRRLGLLLATSLRESVEEIRLNPLGVTFLGPMPSQDLRLFQRVIYPMVVWVPRQRRFFPNWEVEKIVRVPLGDLLDPTVYALYRIRFQDRRHGSYVQDFPCFRHERGTEREILWGATYRIVVAFLRLTFGFEPPSQGSLPVIEGSMDDAYLNGAA